MIDTKNNYTNINLNTSVSKRNDCDLINEVDHSDEDADKVLFLASEDNNEALGSESSSSSPRENRSYELNNEYKNLKNCIDTCSSLEDVEYQEKNNILNYESGETEESETDSENSTEEDNSSDENDPDATNNSIMQQRWKELDKYGSSSHILSNNDNHNNLNGYRLTAPINLSATSSSINHHLPEIGPLNNNYCINNPSLQRDSFMLGINSHLTNNALNMSMRHMTSMENENSYPLMNPKSYKPELINCRLPHQNPNVHLNNSPVNYEYIKEQRLSLHPHQFSVNDMRSQFHINMMMNGHDVDGLQMHSLSNPHMQDFRCNYCNKCYTNQSSLRSHLKKHMNVDEKKYRCNKCSYSTQYQKNLLKHIHINHEELNDNQQCRCDICDRIFSSEFLLKDHLRMHTSDNTYQCQQCGKKLKTKLKLRYHADVHNPEKPYICDVDSCDRAFRTPKYLKNHKDEFHKLQPKKHFCPVDNCKLVFQRKSHLKRHMAMHDGEKNYHCHWPDCNRSFRSQETLNVHLVRHTGEKPFKCELCEYSCRQKASLNYHCRNAHAKDCERLLGLKPFVCDGRPPGTRPVGRPPRNRLDSHCIDSNKHGSSKFDKFNENDMKLETKIESDVNGIISYLEKDPSIADVFKRPAPVDENDLLRKEVFVIVDEVLNNPPKNYGDVEEFTLEELCIIELSIKSKRGRKRKVLKELDALLAQSLNKNHLEFNDEDEDDIVEDDADNDSNNIVDDNDDDAISRSPINIVKSQYTPSIVHAHSASSNNVTNLPHSTNHGPGTYSNLICNRLAPEIISPPPPTMQSIKNNNPLALVTNFMSSISSLNNSTSHSNGVSVFDAKYILSNNTNSGIVDNQSSSHSNTPMSGPIKAELEDNEFFDDLPESAPSTFSIQPTNIIGHKPKTVSLTIESAIIERDRNMESIYNTTVKSQEKYDETLIKHNNNESSQLNSDLLDLQGQEFKTAPFLSPFSCVNNLSSSNNKNTEASSKSTEAPKISVSENKTPSNFLDSSLLSDSGYSSSLDSSGINKESNATSNPQAPSSPPTNAAAAAFIEKTAAAAEMAALSASAALLNSDFYSSYQQNIVNNNRTFGEPNFSPYDGPGFNSELTNMSNICSSMYKSGLEDHLRSLTALGSKYMESSGYQGSTRSDSNPAPEINGVDAFNHLWSATSGSGVDYLSISHHGSSTAASLNPFDPTNTRTGIGDYCNLTQSPTAAAAADFYSQMTASANYDKYPSLYGCRDNFYDNSASAASAAGRGISSALTDGSNHYAERNCLSSTHPFYPQSASNQYEGRYPNPGVSAADYLSMSRQFSSTGTSGNPFSMVGDPYRASMLNNMSPFGRYPF